MTHMTHIYHVIIQYELVVEPPGMFERTQKVTVYRIMDNGSRRFIANFYPGGGTTGDGAGVPEEVYEAAKLLAERECTLVGCKQQCRECGEELMNSYDRYDGICGNCTYNA